MEFSFEHLNEPAHLMGWALPALIRLGAALAIFFIGKWIAEAVVNIVRRIFERSQIEEILASFLCNVLYGVALAVIIVSALGQLGIDTTSAAAVLGGSALAVGLSIQNQLASLAAGVMLIVFRPFKKGDLIQAGGITGVVEEIKIVATVLRSPENHEVTLPNAAIWGNTITNYSARPVRCAELTIPLSNDADLAKAKGIVAEILAAEPRVLKAPEAVVQVKELTSAGVQLAVKPWIKTAEFWDTRCALLERIKLRFDNEGIALSSPGVTVNIQK